MNKSDKQPAVFKKRGTHAEIERKQNRWVVIGFSITAVIIALLIGYGILYETVLKNRAIVASVGDENISAQEFIERVKYYRNYYINQYQYYQGLAQLFATDESTLASFNQQLFSYQNYLDDTQQFGQDVLDQMIYERIFAIEAQNIGITVSEQEIDDFIKVQYQYYPNGTPTPAPTSINFPTPTFSATQKAIINYTPEPTAQTLTVESTDEVPSNTPTPTIETHVNATPEPTATVYTQDLYEKNLKDTYDNLKDIGVSENSYRKLIENYLLQIKLSEAYNQDPEKSEQVWARHILVKTEVEGDIVISRITNGEEWEAVASEVSLDTGTKDKGGDLGWFARGTMVAPFEEVAFSLNIGEISSPVQSDFGWHIIQVIGHDSIVMSFDQWIAQVKSSMVIEKKNWENVVPIEPTIPAELRINIATQ